MGTAVGMSLPSASAPFKKKTSASATTATLWEYYKLSRVLTFDHAGFGQGSSSSLRLGLRLGGRSVLLGGRHGFLVRHRCRGFIPLPRQIRGFPAEHTSWLSIKFDYYIKYYPRRFSTYKLDRTIVTVRALRMLAMSTCPASAGASSCASAAAASSAAMVVGAALSCVSAAICLRGLAAVTGLGQRASGLIPSAGKAGRSYNGCWAVSCWVGLQRGVAGLGRLGWAGRGKGVKEERERV
jgi:hypothetical protein